MVCSAAIKAVVTFKASYSKCFPPPPLAFVSSVNTKQLLSERAEDNWWTSEVSPGERKRHLNVFCH